MWQSYIKIAWRKLINSGIFLQSSGDIEERVGDNLSPTLSSIQNIVKAIKKEEVEI